MILYKFLYLEGLSDDRDQVGICADSTQYF